MYPKNCTKVFLCLSMVFLLPLVLEAQSLDPTKVMPGLVCTSHFEFTACYSPDNKEFYFSRADKGKDNIYYTVQKDERWTVPELAPFTDSLYQDADPMFTPDGRKLFFISNRPNSGADGTFDIYYVDRIGSGWSIPKNLGQTINSDSSEYYASFSANGNLYFASNRLGGNGSFDIYISQYVDGKFTKPVNLGDAINSSMMEHDPLIAPDESYLIYTAVDRSDGLGKGDLYISFHQDDGKWSKAVNMGAQINTNTYDFCPSLSPDGKYFFYSNRGDIYQVKIDLLNKLIDSLRYSGMRKVK